MKILINFFLIILFLFVSKSYAKENKIIFKIKDNIYTSNDLNNRSKYLLIENRINDEDDILRDLISVKLYKESFKSQKIKINNEDVNNYYILIKNKIDMLENSSIEKKIFYQFTKKQIIENIQDDLRRKILIEKELNKMKNEIFKKNNESLFDYEVSIYSFKNKEFSKIKNNNIKIDLDNLTNISVKLKNNNIKYIYQKKIINSLDKVDINIKNAIIKKSKLFKFKDKKNHYIGSIEKKFKTIEKIEYSITQITTKLDLKEKDINCINIDKFINNKEIDIRKINIEYDKLNNKIQNKLMDINDYLKIQDTENNKFVILCDINFDKDLIKNINLNQKISYLVEKIELDFIDSAKKKYSYMSLNDK